MVFSISLYAIKAAQRVPQMHTEHSLWYQKNIQNKVSFKNDFQVVCLLTIIQNLAWHLITR